jgi:hypothetical protein
MTALLGMMALFACAQPKDEASGASANALDDEARDAHVKGVGTGVDAVDMALTFRTASNPCVWSDPVDRDKRTFNIDAWDRTTIPAGGTVPTLITLDKEGKVVGQGTGGIEIGTDGGVYFSGWNFATWSDEYHSLLSDGSASSFRLGTIKGDVNKLVPGQEVVFELAGDYAYKFSVLREEIVIVGTTELHPQTFTPIKVPADAKPLPVKFTGRCSDDNGQ